MLARENFLRSEGRSSLDTLAALQKKRDDLDEAIASQVITTNARVPITNISNDNKDPIHVCGFVIYKYLNSHLLRENSEADRAVDMVA